jgi:hypothetical protein
MLPAGTQRSVTAQQLVLFDKLALDLGEHVIDVIHDYKPPESVKIDRRFGG